MTSSLRTMGCYLLLDFLPFAGHDDVLIVARIAGGNKEQTISEKETLLGGWSEGGDARKKICGTGASECLERISARPQRNVSQTNPQIGRKCVLNSLRSGPTTMKTPASNAIFNFRFKCKLPHAKAPSRTRWKGGARLIKPRRQIMSPRIPANAAGCSPPLEWRLQAVKIGWAANRKYLALEKRDQLNKNKLTKANRTWEGPAPKHVFATALNSFSTSGAQLTNGWAQNLYRGLRINSMKVIRRPHGWGRCTMRRSKSTRVIWSLISIYFWNNEITN